jgi:hypothetical protein
MVGYHKALVTVCNHHHHSAAGTAVSLLLAILFACNPEARSKSMAYKLL